MIAEFESRILALIDGMVDHASDDELFASGYLRGHLTLAIAELESGDDHSAQAVHTTVSQSLEKAIGAGELSPRDQALVTDASSHVSAGVTAVSCGVWSTMPDATLIASYQAYTSHVGRIRRSRRIRQTLREQITPP